MVRSGKSKFKAHYQSGNYQTGNGLLFLGDLSALTLKNIFLLRGGLPIKPLAPWEGRGEGEGLTIEKTSKVITKEFNRG